MINKHTLLPSNFESIVKEISQLGIISASMFIYGDGSRQIGHEARMGFL